MIKSDQFISEELGEDNMFETKETKQIGRRDFLKLASLVSGGAILAACAPAATAVAPAAPTTAAAAPTAVLARSRNLWLPRTLSWKFLKLQWITGPNMPIKSSPKSPEANSWMC
jgi:hypothetical protein